MHDFADIKNSLSAQHNESQKTYSKAYYWTFQNSSCEKGQLFKPIYFLLESLVFWQIPR